LVALPPHCRSRRAQQADRMRRVLGLNIPVHLQQIADEVIE
jgi:hypothetical protein